MNQENYRPAGLFWFSALLLALSAAILIFSLGTNSFSAVPPEIAATTASTPELEPSPEPPDPVRPVSLSADFGHFVATAYCAGGTTASGVAANTGIVAADPNVLPIGSVIELKAGGQSGIYTVLDTGAFIKGRRIDIYLPDAAQAQEFGRRLVGVRVLRHGWSIARPDALG